MSNVEFISIYNNLPKKAGWYAVLYCWEPQEGLFPESVYWDGEKFITQLPISDWADTVFDSKKEALTYACDNDPNW